MTASPPSPGSGGRSTSGEAERTGFIGVIAFESFSPASEADSHIVSEMTRRATRTQWISPTLPDARIGILYNRSGQGLSARGPDAVEALGRLGDECVIPCLTGTLQETASSVCTAAVEALGMLGDEEAEKALVAALDRSNSDRVTLIAGRTPERLRGHRAHEGLTEKLRSSGDRDKTVSVRLEDLCRIAAAMATMVHDMNNGKTRCLRVELDTIHDVVERWVADEGALGGG